MSGFRKKLLLLFIIIFVCSSIAPAQGTVADYQRAEKLLPQNINELVFENSVDPQWIGSGPQFWYRNRIRTGHEFIFVDPAATTQEPAFDHQRLAEKLTALLGKEIKPHKQPFSAIRYSKDRTSITVTIDGNSYKISLTDYAINKLDKPRPKTSGFYETVSPDGKWAAFTREYNLYLRSVDSSEIIQLTFDGTREYAWATPLPSAKDMVALGKEEFDQWTAVFWSPDSARLLTYRIDARNSSELYIVQADPPNGGVTPKLYRFDYPLPGDVGVPKAELTLFTVQTGKRVEVNVDPLPVLYYGGPWPFPFWLEDNRHLAYVERERGWGSATIYSIDADTGQSTVLYIETEETYFNPLNMALEFLEKSPRFIWASERSGWNHLYLYDSRTGKELRQLTDGDWPVFELESIDEESGVAYFITGGKEPGRNPYYKHLYKVGLDGGEPVLLTPENDDHNIELSPDHTVFVDNHSRINTVPVSVLRDTKTGKVILELEKADIGLLEATGWKKPEPFSVKARDGKTDIYGALYFPANFDPSRKYPVIENIYSGPHYVMTPESFNRSLSRSAQSFAELGFVVVIIDGFGTAKRSKAFQDKAYKNLADSGFPDHIAGIRQLARNRPYMDLERVGIYGFSAGGYNTAYALFAHGDFYKAGIAASGNYDHRMDKAWWNELWMDYPVAEHYPAQSCLTIAHQLKGKLMLAHGEVDENVNPYNTIRLVNALIKANKDFELLIMPNMGHYLFDHPYYVRKRWDFFVKHLQGVQPPEGYVVQPFDE